MTQTVSQIAEAATPDTRAAKVVYFDGGCPICRREIGWYRGMAGADRVDWVDIADPATDVPSGLDRQALLGRFTVRRANGALASGAAGFSAMWRALRPTRLLGRLTDRQPFRAIGDLLYRLFLRLRRLWR